MIERQGNREQIAQRARERLYFLVFEEVNQFAQPAFVRTERVSIVESTETAAAERAPALLIERKLILKRGSAGNAKELRPEWL
jgi:hypothetical protein